MLTDVPAGLLEQQSETKRFDDALFFKGTSHLLPLFPFTLLNSFEMLKPVANIRYV